MLPHAARIPVLIVLGLLLAGGAFLLLMVLLDRAVLATESGDPRVADA